MGEAAIAPGACLQQVEGGEDALGGLTAFPHCGDHEVGAAHHVAAGENLGVGGLVGVRLALGDDAATRVDGDLVLFEPRLRIGAEAERDDHVIGRQDFLRTRNDDRCAAAARIGRAEFGGHQLDALDAAVADDLDRLPVPQELHAFFLGIGDLALRSRHVLLVAAIGADDAGCALADAGAIAVHRGVAAAQHHHALALHVVVDLVRLGEIEAFAHVGDQEGQRLQHAGQILAGEAALHVGVGAHAHEHGVVFVEQALHADVLADVGIEAELDAHALEYFAAAGHHRLFHLEFGDAEGEQAADLVVAVVYHRLHAVACQHVGTAQARRAGADDGDPFPGRHHVRHVGAPAGLEGLLGNVALDLADGHRAEAACVRPAAHGLAEAVGVEGAGTLAQAVLRAHAAAYLRQAVGLVGEFGGFEQPAFRHQLEPVGDVVVYRALPLAIGVAATEATVGLFLRVRRIHQRVDFVELVLAHRRLGLDTVTPRLLKKLAYVTHRYASNASLVSPGRSSTRSSIEIRSGLISHAFARVASKSASSAFARALPVSARWRSIWALRKMR